MLHYGVLEKMCLQARHGMQAEGWRHLLYNLGCPVTHLEALDAIEAGESSSPTLSCVVEI